MTTRVPSTELARRVLDTGNLRAAARLITRVEAGEDECRPALAEIYRHTGRAHVVGVTGVPGCGKSTLVSQLARVLREGGRRVGIVAIDPSSPFSGGAILGDRIRMSNLVQDPGVFIRSMATRGALGGLAKASLDAVDVLDAAGLDVILIETVGVGQDEVDIVQAAHTTVVVSAPGLGDDIQAIKAGVLEIADIHVVSKADRADANRTVMELKSMLSMSMPQGQGQWYTPVVATSAEQETGVDELRDAIDRHRAHLVDTGTLESKRSEIAANRMIKIAEGIVREDFRRQREADLADVLGRVSRRETDPHAGALELLTAIHSRIRHD
ncbi:MAG: methylmalonyl Co-A mutase-associated GTPase MeaB [Gammaproteobacteria bacterium]|nr:methylmalonyl Co-A mutase-associated GTPase MeaB [Gammaproteobacteria bacterium]